mgnify:FL=1
MDCISCNFPINEKETVKECEACKKHAHVFCLISKGEQKVCDLCYIKETEEKPSYSFILPEHIRRTHIETYRKCPNKFKLEVLEERPQPQRPYTQVGIDLHEIFEQAVKDRSFTHEHRVNDYKTIYLPRQIEQSIFESEDEQRNYLKRAMDSLTHFDMVLPNIPMPFMVEETLQFNIDENLPKVSFTMDIVTENEQGGLDLADWKTGKELVGKQLASDLQAPIYIHGVQQHTGRRVDSFTFYYLRENKTRKFQRVDNDTFVCTVGKREYYIRLHETVGELQGLFTQMKKGNFNVPTDTKGMFFTCKMCHLKDMGLCMGADQQAWYQLNGGK